MPRTSSRRGCQHVRGVAAGRVSAAASRQTRKKVSKRGSSSTAFLVRSVEGGGWRTSVHGISALCNTSRVDVARWRSVLIQRGPKPREHADDVARACEETSLAPYFLAYNCSGRKTLSVIFLLRVIRRCRGRPATPRRPVDVLSGAAPARRCRARASRRRRVGGLLAPRQP